MSDGCGGVSEQCVHHLFEARVAASRDAVAVLYRTRALTFSELDGAADRIAAELDRRGIGPERLVGVLLPRSPEAIAAMLGILKTGAAYVMLDLESPPERRTELQRQITPSSQKTFIPEQPAADRE